MKLKYFIFIFCLSFATSNLFGQTNHSAKKTIGSLNAASQSNIDVIASGNMDDAVPCPSEYTNIISNTNLFTPDETKLLKEISFNLSTNSTQRGIVKVRDKAGDGYDLYDAGNESDSGFGGGSGRNYWFQQIKHGVKDGLWVEVIHDDHCERWMRYSNGMAVDKWLEWTAYGNKLMLWAKFKEPYDISRFQNE